MIRTERLALRLLTADDVDAFVAYRSDPVTRRWMGVSAPPTPAGAAEGIARMAALGAPVEGEWFRLGIERTGDGALLGDVDFVLRTGGGIAEIGFVLVPEARGHGYASEAAGALVDHLVATHGVHRIEASLAPDNWASMRVLESTGMTFEAIARQAYLLEGVWEDDLRYATTAADRAAWTRRHRGAPASVELVTITPDDAHVWGRLRTHHSQERFVATMAMSWRDALFPETFQEVLAVPWLRGVLADGECAAFVMLSETHGSRDGWYLWRLLVDRMHQRRGIGGAAVRAVADELRAAGVPRLFTSYVDGPGTPGPFYAGLGFVPTGETIDDEIELVLELA